MRSLISLLLVVAAYCVPVLAQEDVVVEMKTAVLSDYVFRGQLRNDDPIAASEVSISKGIFDLDIRGNMDLTDITDNQQQFTEFQIDLGFEKQVYDNPGNKLLSAASIFGGLVYYSFPESDREATTELYAGVDVTTAGGVHLKPTLFYDVDEVDGAYLDLAAYRPIDLPLKFKALGQEFKTVLTPELGLGWGSSEYNEAYWGVQDSAFSDWHAALSLMIQSDKLEFGPSIRYTDLLEADIQDGQDDSANVIYGLSLGYKF
jgi:hypothetical protein